MDLLGGYGSDDSGVSSSSSGDAPRKTEPSPAAAAVAKPKASRVGKRIVSLHAVLPAAIRDRLTKTVDDNDSSSDEEIDSTPPTVSKGSKSAEQRRSATRDAGLSMFLSELQSTTKSFPTKDEGPMGLSLVSAKTTVVRGGVEEDIDDVSKETKLAASTASPSTVPYASPAETPPESKEETVARASSVPFPAAPLRLNHPGIRQAAPAVVHDAAQSSSGPAPPVAASLPVQQQQFLEPPEMSAGGRKSRKRQRQQLEKALRQGNMSAVDEQQVQNTATLEAQDYSHSMAVPKATVSTQHGIKRSAVKLYDSHQGTDVVQSQVSAKHRSKHQINQLMASAISLEAQRAREAGLVRRTNSTRADAKRKYGW